MRKESIVFGMAGIFFGVLVGWIIGSQQAPAVVPVPAAAAAPASGAQSAQAPPPFDEARAAGLKASADRNPADADARVQLGNLYFDAERYEEAVRWYEAALKVDPRNVNASTDLGIAYYYSNQPDRALAQFDKSLAIDPEHSKTLLNIGIVRAFAKQDLDGAEKAWQRVLDVAPASAEAAVAKKGLDGLRAAHGQGGASGSAKPPGPSDQP
jgi:tetratricopeptide (TPR) repeat protein